MVRELTSDFAVLGLVLNLFIPCVGSILNGKNRNRNRKSKRKLFLTFPHKGIQLGSIMGGTKHVLIGLFLTLGFWATIFLFGFGALFWISGMIHSIYLFSLSKDCRPHLWASVFGDAVSSSTRANEPTTATASDSVLLALQQGGSEYWAKIKRNSLSGSESAAHAVAAVMASSSSSLPSRSSSSSEYPLNNNMTNGSVEASTSLAPHHQSPALPSLTPSSVSTTFTSRSSFSLSDPSQVTSTVITITTTSMPSELAIGGIAPSNADSSSTATAADFAVTGVGGGGGGGHSRRPSHDLSSGKDIEPAIGTHVRRSSVEIKFSHSSSPSLRPSFLLAHDENSQDRVLNIEYTK